MTTAISSIGTTAAPPKSDAAIGSNHLGKDEFLKLMMAQLQAQDPTAPVDNQAFIAQLAQFAQVEQTSTTNQQLEALLYATAAGNQTQAASLVGRDITFKSTDVALSRTGPAVLRGDLSADAASVSAILTDANGKPVRTLTFTDVKHGDLSLVWDGLDENGQRVPPGTYTVKLVAADAQGKDLPVDARGYGRASGVTYSNGYPELLINGVRVKMADVIEIRESTPPQEP